MIDYEDYSVQVTIDPTTSLAVTQSDPTDLKVEIHQPGTKEEFEVVQPTAADLKATVTQLEKDRTVTCDTAANLKVEIHQPGTKEEFEVVQPTAADLKATVTQQAKDRTVTCDTAANLKSEVTPAAAAEWNGYTRIPAGATQVAKSGEAANTTTVLHTVSAGKTFYLSAIGLTFSSWSDAAQDLTCIVTDASDVTQYRIADIHILSNANLRDSLSMIPPLEVPSAYKIKITSSSSDTHIWGFLHGYEV